MEKKFASATGRLKTVGLKAGVPSENALHIGEICIDTANDDVYIATDTAGTWVKLID